MLDFGCGCGRVLRCLDELPHDVALYGCDIDTEAVAWVDANLPHVRVTPNGGRPPLPYDANSFDLVFNHRGFTHLPEDYQDAWLAELNRVVRPEGFVVLTVAGDHPCRLLRELARGKCRPGCLAAAVPGKGVRVRRG